MAALISRVCSTKTVAGFCLITVLVLSFAKVKIGTMKRMTGTIQKTPGKLTFTDVKVVTPEKRNLYLIPGDEVLINLSEKELLTMYWKYINTIQVLCRNQTRVGGIEDGGKEMCKDHVYKPHVPCIVYSFGSNFQFDFDIRMHNFYGCDVYTYDPSMNIKGKRLPPEIKFELRGLAGKDYINENKWQMSTLQTIIKKNNHEKKVIDILKIDIEGTEWEAIPAMIQAGVHKRVKQLLIEVHAGRRGFRRGRRFWGGVHLSGQLRTLRLLYESGFRIFMREHNVHLIRNISIPPEEQITVVNEISLINTEFDRTA